MTEAALRPASPLMTVVMYHFVQPPDEGPVAGLRSLDLSAFQEQLVYIRRHYTPVSVADIIRFVDEGAPLPPRPIVLTFDDGYRGHYRHAFPALNAFSMPAVFFPVASALVGRQILDVNKIQCLLAVTNEVGRLVEAIETAVDQARRDGDVLAPSEYRAKWWKPSRWDPAPVVYVKRLLQHVLPESVRRPLVDAMFREFVTRDEAAFADALYMNVSEARELHAAGMTVGAHGDRHVRLTSLETADQAREIDGALRVLDVLGLPRQRFAYCYANGDFDERSVALLRERRCGLAFTTQPALARIDGDHMLTLPRLDANDLPTRATDAPNEWTRRAAEPDPS